MKKLILLLLCLVILIVGVACNNNGSNETNSSVATLCKHDDPTQIISVEATAATCQESGLTAGIKCNLCGTFVTPQAIIPIIDCQSSNWIVDKIPTHQEDGAQHTECTMCKKILKQETLAAGSYGLDFLENDDGTYTVVGVGTCEDTEIVIPKTHNGKAVTSIGEKAFYGRAYLTSITIPDSVANIGGEAFYVCSSLTSVHINDIAAWCAIEFSSNPLSYAKNLYLNGELVTDLVIPESVTSISNSAFYNCTSLTSVTIGNSVTSIGEKAFAFCSSIETITVDEGNTVYHSNANCLIQTASKTLITGCKNSIIPTDGSVTSIGDYAFSSCKSITIPDSVTSIGYYAFYGCTSLTSITIPNSVRRINNHAFRDCTSLTSITFEGTVAEWNAIVFSTYWHYNVPATEVVCSDGVVKLK